MGTEILKIDAEMAEEIEVEVGSFNTEIIFLSVCHFQNLSAHHQEQFLRIPKHSQLAKFE